MYWFVVEYVVNYGLLRHILWLMEWHYTEWLNWDLWKNLLLWNYMEWHNIRQIYCKCVITIWQDLKIYTKATGMAFINSCERHSTTTIMLRGNKHTTLLHNSTYAFTSVKAVTFQYSFKTIALHFTAFTGIVKHWFLIHYWYETSIR